MTKTAIYPCRKILLTKRSLCWNPLHDVVNTYNNNQKNAPLCGHGFRVYQSCSLQRFLTLSISYIQKQVKIRPWLKNISYPLIRNCRSRQGNLSIKSGLSKKIDSRNPLSTEEMWSLFRRILENLVKDI